MAVPHTSARDESDEVAAGHAVVARVRTGDVRAFETLFYEYYDRLVDVARRLLGSRDGAEELVQEVFVRVWERRAHWVVHTTVRAYFYGAVRNAAINALRHDRLVEQYADGQTGIGAFGTTGTWDNRANAPLLAQEMTAVLLQVVRHLPARTQQAYCLRIDHGLSYAEIAEIMGIKQKAVEKLLTRANTALHTALNAYR